ncbi:MAG: serine hydrolase domain-containing protein, partial [Bacteroidota bacterium]
MIFRALILLFSIAAISCVQRDVSDSASVEPVVIDPALQRFVSNFEKRLEESFIRHRVPGAAVAIVIDSSFTYLKAFGKKSSEYTDSVNLETLFRLASVSKGFASILAGKVLTGNGQWADPISKYIKNFEVNPGNLTDSISISHILSHTSGYPYQTYSTLIEDGIKRKRLFEELKKIELSRKPGAIHSYQNVAYSLIEPVIESITDTTYEYALKTLIFTPLNMKTASLTYEGIKNSGNLAQPHGLKRKRYVPIKLSPAYYNVAAAGGINANITDM